MTTSWPNHVFCFLLALTVANVQDGGAYFFAIPSQCTHDMKHIARELIESRYLYVKQAPAQKPHHCGAMVNHLITLFYKKKSSNGNFSIATAKTKHGHVPANNRKISMIFPLVSCCSCANSPSSFKKRLNCLYLALEVID